MTTASGTELDAGVLGHWLDSKEAPGHGERPVLEQLSGGSQNTLYLVRRGPERMVLRMPGPAPTPRVSTACYAKSDWCGRCRARMCRMRS